MASFSYVQQFKIFRDIWQFSYIALYFVLMNIETAVITGFVVIPQLLTLDFIRNPIATWMVVLLNLIATVLLFYYGKYEPNNHFLTEARTWKNKGAFARAFVASLSECSFSSLVNFNNGNIRD